MKWSRWILIAGLAALAACTSPTLSPLPQDPNTDPNKKPDPSTGFVMPVTLLTPPVSFLG